MDLVTLAKYPFLLESRKYLKENGPSLDELINDIAFSTARSLGKLRVLHTMEKTEENEFSTVPECINELLSYIVARILISSASDQFITKWYALDEAVRMNYRLENENMDFVINVSEELGINAKKDSETALIHFTDYLKYATSFRGKKWKLINQDLKNGFVSLDKRKLVRMIREVLKIRFENELPLKVTDEIKNAFKNDIGELLKKAEIRKKKFETKDFGKVNALKFPPCIKHIYGMLQSGENVSHSGRFGLTAFLHNIGMNSNQILKLYNLSPDFDENKARYQIEHITGQISGTEYKALACKAMKTYGICINMDDLCKFISHPIGYYDIKKREYNSINRFSREVSLTIKDFEADKKNIHEIFMKFYNELYKLDWKNPLIIDNFKDIKKSDKKIAYQIKVKITKSFLKSTKIIIGDDEKYFVYSQPIFEDKFGNNMPSLAITDWNIIGKLIRNNNKFSSILGIVLDFEDKKYFFIKKAY